MALEILEVLLIKKMKEINLNDIDKSKLSINRYLFGYKLLYNQNYFLIKIDDLEITKLFISNEEDSYICFNDNMKDLKNIIEYCVNKYINNTNIIVKNIILYKINISNLKIQKKKGDFINCYFHINNKSFYGFNKI